MPYPIKSFLSTAIFALATLSSYHAAASHMVGNDFTYKYQGDTIIGGVVKQKYEVTLDIYADCLHGEPAAIASDNPAFFGVFSGTTLVLADSTHFISSMVVPVTSLGPCGTTTIPALCLLKKTFKKTFYLAPNVAGYTIVYEKCCKNNVLSNIIDPGSSSTTYICTIPPSGTVASNNSAMFGDFPPQVLGLHMPFAFDNSATDADGDSLSYELCATYIYGGADIKPYPPLSPPYGNPTYTLPLSFSNPMPCSAPLTIDSATGILSGTPDAIGCYLIAICCHEWQGGVMINTIQRTFEFTVAPATGTPYRPDAGPDQTIYEGDTVLFAGAGAASYTWTPGTYLTSTIIPDPVGHFPVAGVFDYVLRGTSDSGCIGYDTVRITVLEHSEFTAPNAFTPNGDGHNDVFDAFPVLGSTFVGMKIFNRDWKLLYNSDVYGKGWDGTYQGKKQDVGVYYWQVTYIDNKGVHRKKVGTVTLLR